VHDAAEVDRLRAAREHVLERIAAACARASRPATDVTLVAVTKTVAPDRVRAGVAAGLTILGENRVQEAEGKVGEVDGATWHLVGPLQKNKARRALEVFGVIESVDSVALAERLDRILGELGTTDRIRVLLQVNVDDDPSKAGFTPDGLETALGTILDLPRLDVRGLMTIGRQVARREDARTTFVGLRELSERLRVHEPRLGADLSMGMTDDFEIAVEEGATMVRMGRALFGERPHDHGDGPHTHEAGG
jgi:pyridoxal phosphate enzyme (YggS family)